MRQGLDRFRATAGGWLPRGRAARVCSMLAVVVLLLLTTVLTVDVTGSGAPAAAASAAQQSQAHPTGQPSYAQPPQQPPSTPSVVDAPSATVDPPVALDPPVAGMWTQVFGDEFDGQSVDSARWRRNRYGGTSDNGAFNPKYEDAYYSPRNVTVRDGVATLTMQPDPKTVEGVSYTHSSGCLSSQGRFLMEDGDFIEARLWLPSGGVWPAFWTVPDDRWPPEIDIAENLDTAASSLPEFVYHAADGSRTYGFYGDPSVDYRDSWHTYGLLRSQGAVIPYVDGVPYPKIGVSAGADDLPQFIIINLASMKGRAPTTPVQMKVDWVRVWRPA